MSRATPEGGLAGATASGPKPVCPDFHAAIETIGRRWSGAILWALLDRPLYFSELSASVPGLSDRLLSARLRQLEAEDLIERSVEVGTRPRVSYALSPKGAELEPCMRELADWALRWRERER